MKQYTIEPCFIKNNFFMLISFVVLIGIPSKLRAQGKIDLTSLTSFKTPSANWHIAADARADLHQNDVLTFSPGTGVLINRKEESKQPQDLLFNINHSDLDLELDYMMAKGSNSGIYLQGRYEIQLRDSWSVINPKSADNGGIYERWNEAKPEGQKGYEGHAPRQNASRAPGLWQHIKISFQAPRFKAGNEKIENARILRIELNGVAIQENVELSGPTRGALQNDEVVAGPLRLQGDHGAIAFRNIKLELFDKPRPELLDIKYTVYKGKFEKEPDYKKIPPEAEGTSVILSSNVSNLDNEFLIHYKGTIRVKEPGEYSFNLGVPGGSGSLAIDNKIVVTANGQRGRGKVSLAAGDFPFQLIYSKIFDFAKPALGLAVGGPGIREYLISDGNVASGEPVDPILISAPVNTILRSFIDIDTIRVTHAVNVGSPQQLHYTYDMDKGMIVQVWRGGFLDATPMWHDRGDGSSRPSGSVIQFGKPTTALQILDTPDRAWSADTAGTSYRPKGYVLDGSDRPTFRYQVYNAMVSDVTRVIDSNQGFHREILLLTPLRDVYFRLAEAEVIEMVSEGLYLINDKSYYLRIDDAGSAKPVIRDSNGHKELIISVQSKIGYSILF